MQSKDLLWFWLTTFQEDLGHEKRTHQKDLSITRRWHEAAFERQIPSSGEAIMRNSWGLLCRLIENSKTRFCCDLESSVLLRARKLGRLTRATSAPLLVHRATGARPTGRERGPTVPNTQPPSSSVLAQQLVVETSNRFCAKTSNPTVPTPTVPYRRETSKLVQCQAFDKSA